MSNQPSLPKILFVFKQFPTVSFNESDVECDHSASEQLIVKQRRNTTEHASAKTEIAKTSDDCDVTPLTPFRSDGEEQVCQLFPMQDIRSTFTENYSTPLKTLQTELKKCERVKCERTIKYNKIVQRYYSKKHRLNWRRVIGFS